jgi:hypothetical protein
VDDDTLARSPLAVGGGGGGGGGGHDPEKTSRGAARRRRRCIVFPYSRAVRMGIREEGRCGPRPGRALDRVLSGEPSSGREGTIHTCFYS